MTAWIAHGACALVLLPGGCTRPLETETGFCVLTQPRPDGVVPKQGPTVPWTAGLVQEAAAEEEIAAQVCFASLWATQCLASAAQVRFGLTRSTSCSLLVLNSSV